MRSDPEGSPRRHIMSPRYCAVDDSTYSRPSRPVARSSGVPLFVQLANWKLWQVQFAVPAVHDWPVGLVQLMPV